MIPRLLRRRCASLFACRRVVCARHRRCSCAVRALFHVYRVRIRALLQVVSRV
jgi:hypothetical protein